MRLLSSVGMVCVRTMVSAGIMSCTVIGGLTGYYVVHYSQEMLFGQVVAPYDLLTKSNMYIGLCVGVCAGNICGMCIARYILKKLRIVTCFSNLTSNNFWQAMANRNYQIARYQ